MKSWTWAGVWASLVPGPSPPPVFDRLQYAKLVQVIKNWRRESVVWAEVVMVIETIQVTSDLIEKGVELLQQDCLPLLKNGSRLTPRERSITIIWPQCLENIHHSKFKPINWFGTKLISPKPQNVLVIYLHSAHQGQLAVAIVLQHFRQLRGCTQQRLKASFWGVYTPKTKEPHRLTILL